MPKGETQNKSNGVKGGLYRIVESLNDLLARFNFQTLKTEENSRKSKKSANHFIKLLSSNKFDEKTLSSFLDRRIQQSHGNHWKSQPRAAPALQLSKGNQSLLHLSNKIISQKFPQKNQYVFCFFEGSSIRSRAPKRFRRCRTGWPSCSRVSTRPNPQSFTPKISFFFFYLKLGLISIEVCNFNIPEI